MKILAIDTGLAASSACMFDAARGEILARETLWQDRGHDEQIMPLIARVVEACAGGRKDIQKIAVAIGPGSFTGLRIGVSTARALGLALGVPVAGVSTLAAYAAPVMIAQPRAAILAAIPARNGQLFIAAFARGRAVLQPRLISQREAVRAAGAGPIWIAGPTARVLAEEAAALGIEAEVFSDAPAPDIGFVARLGAVANPNDAPARPFYMSDPAPTPATAKAAPK